MKPDLIIIFCYCYYFANSSPIKEDDSKSHSVTCGYNSCHSTKEGYVNVHLIPHSHDDVGWVKTVDQFYYGTHSEVYDAGVVYIYDNTLESVRRNKNRRFIYVETAFFWKWWEEQDEGRRDILRELVNSGRIEFIGGGWSMNDEAVTHYQSIIDQMAWGLRKLNETFGECGRPKMGWQIDPFGHSNEMASIFASLGYDGVILGRIDYQDKDVRVKNASMEMVWRGSENLGRSTDIFTSVLYNHYDAPAGFCYDVLCSDEPIVDDKESPEYNVEIKAEEFILNNIQDAMDSFQSSNLIAPMGRDFAYQNAEKWYKSIDKLIKYVNDKEVFNGTKYHLLYSTPSCYASAVYKELGGVLKSPLKTDDFFPYATDIHSFWTGFYTSRPTLKRYERMGNNFLQVCKQLHSLTSLSSEYEPKLDKLRDAMGVMQHHDAITGTEKEDVAYDYARLLDIGFKNCEEITNDALQLLTQEKSNTFESCMLTNISQCAFTEFRNKFVVTVYNPLSRPVRKYVRLPVNGTAYSVTGPDGKSVENELVPIPTRVLKIFGRESNVTVDLIFEAADVPPLGFKSFYVQEVIGNNVIPENLNAFFVYWNQMDTGFEIDPATGFVKTLFTDDAVLDINQKFWIYRGTNIWSDLETRPSGAYIFRPVPSNPIYELSETARFEVYRGNIVTEIHQTFNNSASQVIRIYQKEKYVEFDWIIGPLTTDDDEEIWTRSGQEVITRYTTSLRTNGKFYTDSNGRELMERRRNYRPSWDIEVNETQSSNYYPITSKIMMKDEESGLEFAVLTDRAEGGSSLQDGEVELMLLRNSVADDQLGVGESLNEYAFDNPIIARGSHYVVFGYSTNQEGKTLSEIEHEIAEQKQLDSWIFLTSPLDQSFSEYSEKHSMEFSGLKKSLPKNVHIMTLEPWQDSSLLLRLEHIFESNEDRVFSEPAVVDLRNLFTSFEIKSLREATLGGNQWLDESERFSFSSVSQSDGAQNVNTHDADPRENLADFVVIVQPMHIRTFVIMVELKSL